MFTRFIRKVSSLFKNAGFIVRILTNLIKNEDLLKQFLDVLLGKAEVKAIESLIDCNADPFVPPGCKVEEHKKGGFWKWTPDQISLFLSEKQENGVVSGYGLYKELADKPVLNANVLDWLLKPANQRLIPEEWKKVRIPFWGTIYRNADGRLFVRYLCWDGGHWDWYSYWLGRDFGGSHPAAVRAK